MPDPEIAPTNGTSPSGFGDRLRRGREALRLSLDEVAARLNLKPEVVTALEQDRYQDLASAAYARGYLRAYARFLRLDAESFIQSNRQLAIGGPLIRPYAEQSNVKTGRGDLLFKIVGCLIVAVVGLWLVSWWQGRWNQSDSLDKTISLESLTPDEDGSRSIELDVDSRGPEKVASLKEPAKPTEPKAPPAPTTLPAVNAQVAPPAEQSTEPHKRRIELNTSAQAWIEITDAAKTALYYRLAKPGEAISVSGEQPFKLVLGNASAVSLSYDGKLVEINPFIREGVARFTLDDKGAHR